jgi:PKD repeat protein
MSPRKLIIALWAAVVAVALVIVFAPSSDGYREYSATQVAPAAVEVPLAIEKSATVSALGAAPATAPAIPLGGASALLADASLVPAPAVAPSAPMSANAQPTAPVPAEVAKDSKLPENPGQWRRASTVSSAEIEAAVQRDAMTPETAVAFRSACGHDHDLHFDGAGKPLYACAMQIQVGPDTTKITSTPSYPLADTFLLHSRPTATRKIYLDFDGHVTSNTRWNAGRAANLTTPAFSEDADPAFNDDERAIVQESFRRIAEHFAPWDVDVTTEDPGVDGLRKTSPGDLAYGIRVVIGPKSFDTSAAGVAYLNSFNDSIDTPCFTFATGGWDARLIAGVTSHEVGHTVSLLHQGQEPGDGEYFGGHGSGALSWSPIMGNGLRPVNQWAKGEYEDANRDQDNIVAIANPASGIPPIADDHGGTIATATAAPGVSLTGGGIISNSADVDIIKIAAGRGQLTITPKVALTAPNLRLQIKVLDSAGTVIATHEGDGSAGNMAPAPISVALPAEGFYFIQMDGIGNGTGITEGYTDYGSIGYYSLVAAWPEQGNKMPIADASLTTPTTYNYFTQPGAVVNFNGTLSNDPDGLIARYVWNFNDVYSRTATGPMATHRYRAPGIYRPTLTVIDDLGAAVTTTLTVTVDGPTVDPSCSLLLINSSFARLNSVADVANATILVQDQYGNPLRRALVNVAVSGLASTPRITVRTNEFGHVNVTSPKFPRGARGTVRFDVSSVVSPTHPYLAADNDVPAFVNMSR